MLRVSNSMFSKLSWRGEGRSGEVFSQADCSGTSKIGRRGSSGITRCITRVVTLASKANRREEMGVRRAGSGVVFDRDKTLTKASLPLRMLCTPLGLSTKSVGEPTNSVVTQSITNVFLLLESRAGALPGATAAGRPKTRYGRPTKANTGISVPEGAAPNGPRGHARLRRAAWPSPPTLGLTSARTGPRERIPRPG